MSQGLGPTEALYGFVFWLADDPYRVHEIGGAKAHGPIHLALAKFVKENQLPELQENWQEKVKLPSHIY